MKHTIKYLLALTIALLSIFPANAQLQTNDEVSLPLPALPSSLTDPASRADYLLEHFWDGMDMGNTALTHSQDFIEQNFVNFISVFPVASPEGRRNAVGALMHRLEADPELYRLFADTAEIYLYDTDSPMVDEEVYILFLEEMVKSPIYGEDGAVRQEEQLRMALLNRAGAEISDFSFTDRGGTKRTLHSLITPDGPPVLLIFYDPDCESCHEFIGALINPVIKDLITQKRLAIVTVDSGGNPAAWKNTASGLPAEWTVGYENGDIRENDIFAIRNLPSTYLIGPDRKIILKNVKLENLGL